MRADFKINILLQPRIAADPHDFNQLEISVRFADFGITADDSCAFTLLFISRLPRYGRSFRDHLHKSLGRDKQAAS